MSWHHRWRWVQPHAFPQSVQGIHIAEPNSVLDPGCSPASTIIIPYPSHTSFWGGFLQKNLDKLTALQMARTQISFICMTVLLLMHVLKVQLTFQVWFWEWSGQRKQSRQIVSFSLSPHPPLRELSMCEMHYGQSWAAFLLGWDGCGLLSVLFVENNGKEEIFTGFKKSAVSRNSKTFHT